MRGTGEGGEHAVALAGLEPSKQPSAVRSGASGVDRCSRATGQAPRGTSGHARHPADAWLRAAVTAVTTDRGSLEVVFGPLHQAITQDRLAPYDWDRLSEVLPPDADPARRLRKLLVERIRSESWPADRIERALGDAGPHLSEIRRDLEGDDVFTQVIKSVLEFFGI